MEIPSSVPALHYPLLNFLPNLQPQYSKPQSVAGLLGAWKIMEGILLVHIPGDTREKKVSGNSQHGFTKDTWYLTNLIAFYDKITRSVKEMTAVNIIYLDLSKAFDTVCYNIPEFKLRCYSLDV